MTMDAWRGEVSAELRRLSGILPKGKRRRSWKRKAWDFDQCGKFVAALACSGCGDVMVKSGALLTSCDFRVCPVCARRRSNVLRKKIRDAYESGKRPRKMGLYLLTFTLRFDPADPRELAVAAIKKRKDIVADGFRYVWRRYLKQRSHAAVRSIEVSSSGMVHAHVLYHGRRPDIAKVRADWMARVGNSPMVNVQYVKRPGKAINEVAKYVTKGASPAKRKVLSGARGEFTHPVLAARIEVACAGARLVECYGAWRGASDDEEEEQENFDGLSCTKCGLIGEWHKVAMTVCEWMAHFGRRWKPRLSRAGPRGKK